MTVTVAWEPQSKARGRAKHAWAAEQRAGFWNRCCRGLLAPLSFRKPPNVQHLQRWVSRRRNQETWAKCTEEDEASASFASLDSPGGDPGSAGSPERHRRASSTLFQNLHQNLSATKVRRFPGEEVASGTAVAYRPPPTAHLGGSQRWPAVASGSQR